MKIFGTLGEDPDGELLIKHIYFKAPKNKNDIYYTTKSGANVYDLDNAWKLLK